MTVRPRPLGTESKMLIIDGSYGEGGGQILRTSLSFSALLGLPVRIEAIRARRKKSGLMPQHLAAVKALQEICRARVAGAALSSTMVTFEPEAPRPGEYHFEVGTAGSVTLILQAVLPPLLFSGGESQVHLKGGTHVPLCPPFHYLERVFLPALAWMGLQVTVEIKKWGWYPKGGGEILARIKPAGRLTPLRLGQAWKPERIRVLCASSNLPEHIRERERQRIKERLGQEGLKADYESVEGPSPGQGNIVFIAAGGGQGYAGFSSLGQRGKRAEQVADEAAGALLSFLKSGASVEEHLSDQLIPYLALAEGDSEILVPRVSSHLQTHLWVVRQFLKTEYELREEGPVQRLVVSPGDQPFSAG